MASHQGGSEFLLSHSRLSIKHLLITAFLTPAHYQGWGGGSCKHLVLQFRPDSGDRCTGESCVIGIQTIGKGVPQEESKAALSQGHCRPAVKYIEKMAKMVEGGSKLQDVLLPGCLCGAAKALHSNGLERIGVLGVYRNVMRL